MADDLPTSRPEAVATCAYCGWQAKLTGDDWRDVVGFLRKKLTDHVDAMHPDHATGRIEYRGITLVNR